MRTPGMRFDGKVAFVTGGAIGFGREFCAAYAAEGAAVVLADVDLDAATASAAALTATGARAIAVRCDVADDAEVKSAVAAAVDAFGGVDILVNNAGKHLTRYNKPFGEMPLEEVRACIDVNMMGVVQCTLACRDSMASRGGGSVINLSSIASFMSTSIYGVTKLAVRGLTIAFATELAPHHIRVNGIAPGLMATESSLADLPGEMFDGFVSTLQLVKRRGTMDDVVSTGLFLSSDDAGFITGETITVSGGYPLSI
jgi:3-oxoacyl-[acyl-carrier protein] reductase